MDYNYRKDNGIVTAEISVSKVKKAENSGFQGYITILSPF